jgi:hypothetical protein
MQRSPSEFFFRRRKPFMQRTVRDDVVALLAGLAGFAAGYLLIGDEQPSVFAFFVGAGLVAIVAQGVVRHLIRQRRDERALPPE